jgi:hypothetical protein
VKIDAKGQGAIGITGQSTGQGAVLPGQIVGQGANIQGLITGQGAMQSGTGSGQGANFSGGNFQGPGAGTNSGLVGEKKIQEERKRGELEGGDEVDMADLSKDIFMVDEEKFPPGNYYNVRAGRQVMRGRSEREMGNAPDLGRRKECGFDLLGDDRVKGAVMRFRMDCNVTMSLSFNPANMVCEGCVITINVPLFKKLRDIIFFGGENHFMSHFE